MKRNVRRLIIILMCVAVGWAVGFLRLPYVEENQSFWVGFISCLALIVLLVALLIVWNKYELLIKLIGKHGTAEGVSSMKRTYRIIGVITILLVLMGWIFSAVLFDYDKTSAEIQHNNQTTIIQEQARLIRELQNRDAGNLISNAIRLVENDLTLNVNRSLNSTTINSIAVLSSSLNPYQMMEGDSLSSIPRSPERGQLLRLLCALDIDSVSFRQIKTKATFQGADLRGSELSGLDLSEIDLGGADLSNAILDGVNLSHSNLNGASFWGANLTDADLSHSSAKRCNLSWTEMNSINLNSANLNGSSLCTAQITNAQLRSTKLRWTDMSGALLLNSNCHGSELFGANLTRANLSDGVFIESLLRRANFTDAILDGSKLNHADVEKDWLEKLNEWNVIGRKVIQENHRIKDVTPAGQETSIYELIKKGLD